MTKSEEEAFKFNTELMTCPDLPPFEECVQRPTSSFRSPGAAIPTPYLKFEDMAKSLKLIEGAVKKAFTPAEAECGYHPPAYFVFQGNRPFDCVYPKL